MDNRGYRKALIKRAYNFSLKIMSFIDSLNTKNVSVQIIVHQLLRSATSSGANIIEAQALSSKKRFYKFYSSRIKIS